MRIEIKNNCFNCPFLVTDMDYDAVGHEIMYLCNLLNFGKESHKNHILECVDHDSELEILHPLEDCPLKTESFEVNF